MKITELAQETVRLAGEATPGPWEPKSGWHEYPESGDGDPWAVVEGPARDDRKRPSEIASVTEDGYDLGAMNRNAAFISHARTAAPALAEALLLLDRLTATDLTTARDDDYGVGWNAALAALRQRMGLVTP